MAEQAQFIPFEDRAWPNAGVSLVATREHILTAMRDLHDNATDTLWLTPHETVFDRLANIFLLAGGTWADLAQHWPQYYR